MTEINIPGLVGLIIFYLLILGLGIGVAYWKSRKQKGGEEVDAIVAGREIGIFVGVFTMTATWVDGGFLNGTSEIVYKAGLLHAQTPIGYAISLILGGFFFAGPYRRREYLTMIDPFQEKYGPWVGALMYFPALSGELLWSAAILNALGASVSVILGIDLTLSVVVSAAVAVVYTFFGGLFSVAYTDVAQLLCIPIGLCLAIPYAWSWPAVDMSGVWERRRADGALAWLGRIEPGAVGEYVDLFVLLICGGIPWQAYFQRVLSSKSVRRAQVLSVVGGLGCILMSIPPAFIGFIAQNVDWDTVTFIALGAISAAVMSSSDSSLLSSASMFAHNIYRLGRPGVRRISHRGVHVPLSFEAGDKEIIWVLRASVVVCGSIATAIALQVQSVHTLFYLCGDFVFVILFPQLLAVIYLPFVNSYGVLSGYFTGLVLRLLVGVPDLGFPGAISFDANVPYKSGIMLINMLLTVAVSLIFNSLIPLIGQRCDVLRAYRWEHGACLGPKQIRPSVQSSVVAPIPEPKMYPLSDWHQ